MRPDDKTAKSQAESITFEVELPHAPAKVWRALTDPALLAEWLLPAIGFALERGTAFRFQAAPQPGWDGTVSCKVLDVEPGTRLRWEWVVGDLDTVVTFTLTPTPTGTLLALVHSGFRPEQKQAFGGARYGWRMMTEKLVELLGRVA